MLNLFSGSNLHNRRTETFGDSKRIEKLLGLGDAGRIEKLPGNNLVENKVELPDTLKEWLSRLMLLYGVPFNYLVPDEGMLPPESIRFFYLDRNWLDALIDGAFSIGRNLSTEPVSPKSVLNSGAEPVTPSMNLDRAVLPEVSKSVKLNLHQIRAKVFGLKPKAQSANSVDNKSAWIISGFFLRSSLVTSYPGMGVNAYSKTNNLLPILRLEQLGQQADTIICLVEGDAFRFDVHEAPEGLHYGIDSYSNTNGVVAAEKNIHTFTRSDTGDVTLNPLFDTIDIKDCFRQNSQRTMKMQTLAGLIPNQNSLPAINSAEMGFEMSEGVGMVKFIRPKEA